MNEQFIQQTIEQFRSKILMSVRHRTLRIHAGEPDLREDRLFFLLLPYLNGEHWNDEHEQSAISVAVIYSALAAHDQIKELNASSKSQQLTVLAGDYYSGLYYQMLAKLSNIDLIRSLSNGIIDISEKKASVYDNVKQSFEKWMETIQTIESLSIEQFHEHFEYIGYHSFVRRGLLIHRLENELELVKLGKSSRFQESLTESESEYGFSHPWLVLLNRELANQKIKMMEDISQSHLLSHAVRQFLVDLYKLRLNEQVSVMRER
ncbi:heptaprenyl diphosphate synthase component 1 [Paenisporosarcina sp. NPDC076898]|uniref:heptaprenyl diphosphate synthase component 1 n=1 Tax=unclassified Paenisporosarcina TaxID=2642018 RepID=UPI003CFE3D83